MGYSAIILVLGTACAFEIGDTRDQSRYQECCLVIYGKAFTFLSGTFKEDTSWFRQFLDGTSQESIANYIDCKIKEAHSKFVWGHTGENYLTSCERGKFMVIFHYCTNWFIF